MKWQHWILNFKCQAAVNFKLKTTCFESRSWRSGFASSDARSSLETLSSSPKPKCPQTASPALCTVISRNYEVAMNSFLFSPNKNMTRRRHGAGRKSIHANTGVLAAVATEQEDLHIKARLANRLMQFSGFNIDLWKELSSWMFSFSLYLVSRCREDVLIFLDPYHVSGCIAGIARTCLTLWVREAVSKEPWTRVNGYIKEV